MSTFVLRDHNAEPQLVSDIPGLLDEVRASNVYGDHQLLCFYTGAPTYEDAANVALGATYLFPGTEWTVKASRNQRADAPWHAVLVS